MTHTTEKEVLTETQVREFEKSLDKKWIDEITKVGKHEIIAAYRLQLIYSARQRMERQKLIDSNNELREIISELIRIGELEDLTFTDDVATRLFQFWVKKGNNAKNLQS